MRQDTCRLGICLIIYLIQWRKQTLVKMLFWNRTLDKPGFRYRHLGISNLRWRSKLIRRCALARPTHACIAGYMLLSNLMFTSLQGPGFHSGHSPGLHLAMLCGLLLLSQRALPPSHCTVRRLKPSPQVFEHCKRRKTL